MIVRCQSFGSLWWLRPGSHDDDPARFVSHAALFNTTGFARGAQKKRRWLVAGVVRINIGMHPEIEDPHEFTHQTFESSGLERRGSWNRLLLGRAVRSSKKCEVLLLCANSNDVGRIDFNHKWHTQGVKVVAASANAGVQETLLLIEPGSRLITNRGVWEATWNSLELC